MPMRTLKLRGDLPRQLEERLKSKWGFKIQKTVIINANLLDRYTLFAKPYISDQEVKTKAVIPPLISTSEVVQLFPGVLTAYEQAALERRCNNIVAFFPDPYNAIIPVRTRLHNMAQSLTKAERQYVLEYMDDNFPLTDKGK